MYRNKVNIASKNTVSVQEIQIFCISQRTRHKQSYKVDTTHKKNTYVRFTASDNQQGCRPNVIDGLFKVGTGQKCI